MVDGIYIEVADVSLFGFLHIGYQRPQLALGVRQLLITRSGRQQCVDAAFDQLFFEVPVGDLEIDAINDRETLFAAGYPIHLVPVYAILLAEDAAGPDRRRHRIVGDADSFAAQILGSIHRAIAPDVEGRMTEGAIRKNWHGV